MSRIGKKPIAIPAGVKVEINENNVTVTGKLGNLSYQFSPEIDVVVEDDQVVVTRKSDIRQVRALHGLTRALIQNMINGISVGYNKTLQVVGTGYSAERLGPWLKLALGYSHEILMEVPKTLTVETEAIPRTANVKIGNEYVNSIVRIKGIEKQQVGAFSAEVRGCRPPENYRGKGVRYFGERVTIKATKASK